MKLSRRSMLASTAALAAGCSFAEPPLDAPSVPQAVALNVAAPSYGSLGNPLLTEERSEDTYRRGLTTLESNRESPYGPTRGGYSLALQFYEELYPHNVEPITTEEARTAALDTVEALLADLVILASHDATRLGPEGLLLPLDRFSGPAGAELKREFFPSVLDQFRRDGALYALPIGARPLMLYYDEDHFKLHGVPPVDASWDWDDLLESAVRLTTREVDGTVARWGLIAHLHDPWWALWQNRAEAVDPVTLQCRLQEPAAVEALQFVHDLIHKYRVSPPVPLRDLFELILGQRSLPAMLYSHDALLHSGFRTAALPRGRARAVPVRGHFGIGIAARTTHTEAAYTALRGLAQSLQEEAAVPASRAAVARLEEIRTDLRPEEVAALQLSLEHGRAEPLPAPPLGTYWEGLLSFEDGDDVTTMVNRACDYLRTHQQQSASPPLWGRAV
ncbi:MAG: extracellular solute-binding protein [Chloroflexi bacterium]|nr:extracellular solute-binding protein [Chloroflexota bacterium]